MMIQNALILGAKRNRGMKLLSSAANYALGPSSSCKCMLSSSWLSYKHRLSSSLSPLHHQYRLLSSSSSSSTSEYDLFFPSFYREYMSHLTDWFASHKYLVSEPSFNQPMACPDFEDKPHYTCDSVEPLNIQEGQHFDVISLLSTHSDDLVRVGSGNNKASDFVKANHLRGKYILLCCAFAPSVWIDSTSYYWRELSLLSSELYIGHNDVEVVIVPKMRQKWADDEGVFQHFLSAFPGCLTVPFTHKYRHDYICKSVNFEKTPRCILVDPSQKVLQDCLEDIGRDGARGFPFTYERCLSILGDDRWDEPRSPSLKSLAGLLGCESNPSSFLLQKFDSGETISVEQLNKHLVGLYLFKVGDYLENFRKIYKQCKFEGLDFEIVLVCLPFNTPIHPDLYQDVVLCALEEFGVSNWWLFPFNNSTSRRLYNLSDEPGGDSMFIVGPHNKFVTRQGGELLRFFGFHFGAEAYPFTFEAVLQALLHRLEAVTLESFLTFDYVYTDYECADTKTTLVSDLRGKNVLVYVTTMTLFETYEVENVVKWHDIIKEKDSDFEVVLVLVIDPFHDIDYPRFCSKARECLFKSKTKWLVCPFHDPRYHRYLMNHEAFLLTREKEYAAKKGVPIPSVLAFGEDGHLHSLDALGLFDEVGIENAYPFRRESRISTLCSHLQTNMFYEFDLLDVDASF